MATKGRTLDVFRSQIGNHESPSGSNCQKYSRYWHHPCESWCADFLCWGLKMAGALDVAMSAYTPTLAQHYKDAHRWHTSPLVGDIVFFDFIGRISHVGIVEAIDGDYLVTIEGNTDEAGGRTGGKVMRHRRYRHASYVVGFGRPKYSTAPAPARHTKHTSVIRRGATGRDVVDAQTLLNSHGARPKLARDGQFGPATEAAVRAFQKREHISSDGVIGPVTWRHLED